MQVDSLLINREDIKKIRPTAEIPNGRIEPYIQEAQDQDIRPLLGDSFYLDFLENFDNTGSPSYNVYNDLLVGKKYGPSEAPVFFRGVKTILVYYTLARFLPDHPFHITAASLVQKTIDNSSNADPAVITRMVNQLKSTAVSMSTDLFKYLNANYSLYPNWKRNDIHSGDKTSFNFFKG